MNDRRRQKAKSMISRMESRLRLTGQSRGNKQYGTNTTPAPKPKVSKPASKGSSTAAGKQSASSSRAPKLTGRENALTRGKGKKTGLKRITSPTAPGMGNGKASKLRGRENALTRGKGKKTGLKRRMK